MPTAYSITHTLSPESRATPRDTDSPSSPHVLQPESLTLPDGAVDEEAAELLIDLVYHRHQEGEETHNRTEDVHRSDIGRNSDNSDEDDERQRLPWWKRPSPWWLLVLMPVTATSVAATMAPRVEIYTMLACSVHRPDIFEQSFISMDLRRLGFSYDDTDYALPSPLVVNTSAPLNLALNWNYPTGDGFRRRPQFRTYNSPKKLNTCASDPIVQAAVAKLTAVMSACMGILSCLTTAWWGSFSDRHGRTRVLGISIFGMLLTDFNFIFVTLCSQRSQWVPGGYWFLIVGPLVEGCLGGLSGAIAAVHASLADTTYPTARSRTFSLMLGLLFAGTAVGPALGGLLIRFTHEILSVFYVATGFHLAYTILIWFVIPESLSPTQMRRSRMKYAEDLKDAARHREMNPAVGMLVRTKQLFAFLSPLAVIMPGFAEKGTEPLKRRTGDWNLTLLAAAYGFAISIMGSITYKFQYASSTFGWNSETIGYWLSLISAARAVYLTAMLPVIIKFFKSKVAYLQLSREPTETQPLLSPSSATSSEDHIVTSSPPPSPNPKPLIHQKEMHSPTFDLNLARFSLLIEVLSYTFMGLASTPLTFTIFGMLGALGIGFSPALQSVALDQYMRRGGTESGRLFGALSVIQSLCSQILGPAIFGFVYMKTVATSPRAIFFVSVGAITLASLLLSFVRLPKSEREVLASDVESQESGAAAC